MVDPVPNIIIGIGGHQHVGKSTAAEYIRDEMYRNKLAVEGVIRLGFSTRLKEICAEMGHDGTKDDRGRAFYQDVGAAARKYDSDVWVRLASNIIVNSYRPGTIILIDDVRHVNECEWINSCPRGVTIRINGPYRTPPTGDLNHESEVHLDECDWRWKVRNEGELSDMHAHLNTILRSIA